MNAHKHYVPKASADVKNSTFLEKMGDEAVGSLLRQIILKMTFKGNFVCSHTVKTELNLT